MQVDTRSWLISDPVKKPGFTINFVIVGPDWLAKSEMHTEESKMLLVGIIGQKQVSQVEF